jgi:hypothetical protein
MFGYIGEIHRASRLLALVPLYSLVSAAGFISIAQRKSKVLAIILTSLLTLNYFDFAKYYFTSYAKDTQTLFNCFSCYDGAYKTLKFESTKLNLTPVVDKVILKVKDPAQDFAKAVYFTDPIAEWNGDKKHLDINNLLMTDDGNVSYLKQINLFGRYYFYMNK